MNSFYLKNLTSIPSIVQDYLNDSVFLHEFYQLKPIEESLLIQAKQKINSYEHRELLYEELKKQTQKLILTQKQQENLERIKNKNTVTLITGHQLNLVTGSIFYHYKILQIIKWCDLLNQKQQEYYFVPVFWMATEDHDFDEINHFHFQNKTFTWKGENDCSVGRKKLDGLQEVLEDFLDTIKYQTKDTFIQNLLEKSYFSSENLAEASQKLVHECYKEYGLLFIDGDSHSLKKVMIPCFKEELIQQISHQKITQTTRKLASTYKIQVNPREINLFYQHPKGRFRIEYNKENYLIINHQKEVEQIFTPTEILEELEKKPENFSPNALLRPFYQEVITPNVGYIGGNAEISYWLELKNYFDNQKIPFPVLIPRDSFLWISHKQNTKIDKLNVDILEFIQNKTKAIDDLIMANSIVCIDFQKNKQILKQVYEQMILEAKKTDKTLINLLLAQQKKQLNSFDKIKKRIKRAEKRRQQEYLIQLENLYEELFPKGKWQERTLNFTELYLVNSNFFKTIYQKIVIDSAKLFCIKLK